MKYSILPFTKLQSREKNNPRHHFPLLQARQTIRVLAIHLTEQAREIIRITIHLSTGT